MAHRVRVGELLLAIEGLALARHLFGGDPTMAERRLDGMRHTLAALDAASPDGVDDPGRNPADDPVEAVTVELSEADIAEGYERWSASYDEAENPLLTVEERILRSLITDVGLGTALDACTGTGRHARLLQQLGHEVTGIDQSPHMLELARMKVPGASFIEADLRIPGPTLADASFDLVVCALALTHFESLSEPIAALAGLTRRGGRIVLTDMHPMAVILSGQALFNDERDGRTRFVRNYVHQVSDYLEAFAAAGLVVHRCVEHVLTPGEGPMANLAGHLRPEATAAAYVGMPYVLAWSLDNP